MAKKKLSTKEIENKAIECVEGYLKSRGEKPEITKKGIDVISGEKWIEVKGSMKKETNLRTTWQTLKYVEKNDKLRDFFIYYVFDMESGNPKLLIFDHDTFEKYKLKEIRWIIQPRKIIRETGKPEIIRL
ncbi:MAG: DUF3883 domain-containing protein [Candidatus Atabeyarchaeum deiterrae]